MHNDLEFLDDPARAEDDAAPATVYEKPMSDEEDGAFNFDPPGIVFQSVYEAFSQNSVTSVPSFITIIALKLMHLPIFFLLIWKHRFHISMFQQKNYD